MARSTWKVGTRSRGRGAWLRWRESSLRRSTCSSRSTPTTRRRTASTASSGRCSPTRAGGGRTARGRCSTRTCSTVRRCRWRRTWAARRSCSTSAPRPGSSSRSVWLAGRRTASADRTATASGSTRRLPISSARQRCSGPASEGVPAGGDLRQRPRRLRAGPRRIASGNPRRRTGGARVRASGRAVRLRLPRKQRLAGR